MQPSLNLCPPPKALWEMPLVPIRTTFKIFTCCYLHEMITFLSMALFWGLSTLPCPIESLEQGQRTSLIIHVLTWEGVNRKSTHRLEEIKLQ